MFQAKTSQESAIPGIYSVPWAGLREDPSGFLQALENCWILWPLLHNAGGHEGYLRASTVSVRLSPATLEVCGLEQVTFLFGDIVPGL